MPRTAAHLEPWRWQPGKSANPAGRPKGARSKLQEFTLNLLLDDFSRRGQELLDKVAQRSPETYLKAVVSLLPKQAEKIESPFVDLTDQELELLEHMLASIRAKTVENIPKPKPKPQLALKPVTTPEPP